MTLSPALSHSLRHSQASIEGSSPCLDVYSYLSIVSHEEILAVVNQIVLSSFLCLLWPTILFQNVNIITDTRLPSLAHREDRKWVIMSSKCKIVLLSAYFASETTLATNFE
jgi:hypothetical protein